MQRYFSAYAGPDQFGRVASRLGIERGADMFLTGQGFDGENRQIIGVDPCAELIVTASTDKAALRAFAFGTPGPALGFLSYGYGLALRGVATAKPAALPLGHFKKYEALVCYDKAAMRLDVFAATPAKAEALLAVMHAPGPDIATDGPDQGGPDQGGPRLGTLAASLDHDGYVRGVEAVRERIRDGHTYQLNLSIRFDAPCRALTPAHFLHLWRTRPAPMYAWFASGNRRILSTSPERFLKVERGQVLSQPIKGTLAFEKYSPLLAGTLRRSAKEDAELSMIVDLIRNDVSANCAFGSVRVEGHKSVMVVENLLQMYSNVRGELREGADCVDLLLDAFPGGSVTGCPKQRSMEIIEALEPHARDVYCGSMVALWDERNMDSSVAIRTGWWDADAKMFHFYAGSGITVDSDPEREYEETMAKASKFLEMVGA
ncbi:MAG: chorismate-binding protein [Desulfovibrionaceae bacterium]